MVVFHVWFGRVSGGVDVFLVLSGYFFTGLLVRQGESGAVRVWFTVRRTVRRLLPALLVVLAAVVVATVVLRPITQWGDIADQTLASLFYYQNWHLAMAWSDYLAADPSVSPLQHLWSMSVQGQFYLAITVLVAVVAWVCRRVRRPGALRPALLVLLGVLTVASFLYARHGMDNHQGWNYYDSFARAWELLAGSLLALAAPWLSPPRLVRSILAVAGLAVVSICGRLVNGVAVFPGPYALIPVGATAALILAGNNLAPAARPRLLRYLAARPTVELGALGYALYLWHWPVLIFFLAQRHTPTAGFGGGLAVIATSLVLAYATHHLVEEPLRLRSPSTATPTHHSPSTKHQHTSTDDTAPADHSSTRSPIEHPSSTGPFDANLVEPVDPPEPFLPSLIERSSATEASDGRPVEPGTPGQLDAPLQPSTLVGPAAFLESSTPGKSAVPLGPGTPLRSGTPSLIEHSSGTDAFDADTVEPVVSITPVAPPGGVQTATPIKESVAGAAVADGAQRISRPAAGPRRTGGRGASIHYRHRVGTLVAALGVLAIAASGGWRVAMGANPPLASAALNAVEYPGGEALASGVRVPHARMRPTVLEAPDDTPQSTADGCISDFNTTTLITCDYGDTGATRTIAVVGSSHAEHWLPALDILAHRHRFRLRVMLKMGCPLTVSDNVSYKGRAIPDCRDWSRRVIELLGRQRPDWVFTTGTRPRDGIGDETPQDYLDVWSQLAERGLNVLAMRDTPWLRRDGVRYRATDCLARGGTSAGCGLPRDYALDPVDPEIAPASRFPNVVPIDLTDAVCAPDVCPVSAGNILIYHDEHHLTATYSRSLAPALERTLRPILGWW